MVQKRRPRIRDSDDEAEEQIIPSSSKRVKTTAKEAELEQEKGEEDEESEEDEDTEYEVDCLIKRRKAGKTKKWEYLVHWKGYGVADRTWEPEDNLVEAADALEDFKRKNGIVDEPKKAKGRAANASKASRRQSKIVSESPSEDNPVRADKRKPASGRIAKASSSRVAKKVEEEVGVDGADPDAHLAQTFAASEEPEDEETDNGWDVKYADQPSWATYVSEVVTVEASPGGIKVLIKWSDGTTKFIPGTQAREKIPTIMLDFYEQHLTFSSAIAEEEDGANGV